MARPTDKGLISKSKLTAIGDAIRGKTGGSAALTPDQMATAIAGIKTDPILQAKSVTPSASDQTITPDSNYDGLSQVVVSGDADLVPENIAKGITIFDVTGTMAGGEGGYCWAKIDPTTIDTNTLLLLHADSFSDSSGNDVHVSSGGTTISEAQSKFGDKSFYFDGSSYMTIEDDIVLGTGNFTIDFWVYRSSSSTAFRRWITSSIGAWTGNTFCVRESNTSAVNTTLATSSATIASGAWHHIAVVRNGSTQTIYIDGVSSASVSDSTNYSEPIKYIGGCFETSGTEYFVGYMDEIRISNTARWTSNFTVPTSRYEEEKVLGYVLSDNKDEYPVNGFHTDGYYYRRLDDNIPWYEEGSYYWTKTDVSSTDPNTLLLLHGEDLTDSSASRIGLTNSGVTVSDAQSKFGGKSLYFDGSANLKFPAIDFGSSDFTIDWWEYVTNSNSKARFCNLDSPSTYAGLLLGYAGTNVYASSTTSSWSLINGTAMFNNTVNQWVHWAFVRSGGTLKSYRNGTLFATASLANASGAIAYTDGLQSVIGDFCSGEAAKFIGYMDEFRISNVARWTADFTVPSEPYASAPKPVYVVSDNPSEFPEDGTLDGYYYKLQQGTYDEGYEAGLANGVPPEMITGTAKISINRNGTGTVSLNCQFDPMFVYAHGPSSAWGNQYASAVAWKVSPTSGWTKKTAVGNAIAISGRKVSCTFSCGDNFGTTATIYAVGYPD